ncbi:anthranilate phosphoribosyltransferase [Tardisphaera miroshnichenkoae]
MDVSEVVERLLKGKSLNLEESATLALSLVKGELSEVQASALLVALRAKGEVADEIAGFALSLRSACLSVGPWPEAVDTAGTGGDRLGTFNVSTAAAIIVSPSAKVAKHGNRGASSKSGSADLLEALGYNIYSQPSGVEKLLKNPGFAFLFAQQYHPAMKGIAPVRKALGIRTIFNLLGPLINPAGVKRQVIGVFSGDFMRPMAEALVSLGTENAYLVHGHPGMDEVSISGNTKVMKVSKGGYEQLNITLEDLKVKEPINIDKLTVTDPNESALRFIRALKGKDPSIREFIKANAAVALMASEKVSDISDGVELAEALLDRGYETLKEVVSSHGNPEALGKLAEMIDC